MSIRRVVPNIPCSDLVRSREFYVDLFGFMVAMDLGWIVTLASPTNPTAQISLVAEPQVIPTQSPMSITIEVGDIDAIYAHAIDRSLPITYPLTQEPWGIRRFFVPDPSGLTINVMCHAATNT